MSFCHIHALCYDTCKILILEDVLTPNLNSTCGSSNLLDMIWRGTHLCGLTAGNAYESKEQVMSWKEPPAEFRDRTVSKHGFGEDSNVIIRN